MKLRKRVFDLMVACVLVVPLLPLGIVIGCLILLKDGRPVLYASERMRDPSRGFALWKFRTMTPVATDSGVSGSDKSNRITPIGRFLRRTRMDEIPQIWNVLRGDISFVGPRPPLRQYVEAHPEIYAQVLRSQPGITGLATLTFKDTEARLLESCQTPAETDAMYRSRCIPSKARLDLIYQNNATLCWDVLLMWQTIAPTTPKKAKRL